MNHRETFEEETCNRALNPCLLREFRGRCYSLCFVLLSGDWEFLVIDFALLCFVKWFRHFSGLFCFIKWWSLLQRASAPRFLIVLLPFSYLLLLVKFKLLLNEICSQHFFYFLLLKNFFLTESILRSSSILQSPNTPKNYCHEEVGSRLLLQHISHSMFIKWWLKKNHSYLQT